MSLVRPTPASQPASLPAFTSTAAACQACQHASCSGLLPVTNKGQAAQLVMCGTLVTAGKVWHGCYSLKTGLASSCVQPGFAAAAAAG